MERGGREWWVEGEQSEKRVGSVVDVGEVFGRVQRRQQGL